VTLESLSTRCSGLPALSAAAQPFRRTVALWQRRADPYGEDLEQLLEQARSVRLGRPRARYSDFGFELLGHALGRAAGTTCVGLLRERITEPLGLEHCYAPATPDELRAGAVTGAGGRGRFRKAWAGEAIVPAGGMRASVPAGGMWASITDMAD
jgi:CubicO group peptidase (beta-lactamase class C family)